MEDSDLALPDVDAYLRYAQLLKKKAVSKSLSDLGFTPIRYPWNRLGKVQGLRAIVPSAQPYDDLLKTASAPRKKSKPGLKKSQSPQPLPPDFKYAWDLEGHKVLAATYQTFTANDNRPQSAKAHDVKGPISAIPERLIEKTEQAVKKHLDDIAREVYVIAFLNMLCLDVYSTFLSYHQSRISYCILEIYPEGVEP